MKINKKQAKRKKGFIYIINRYLFLQLSKHFTQVQVLHIDGSKL